MRPDTLKIGQDLICVAGKNDIAVSCLEHLLELGVDPGRLCVVLNGGDDGRSTWQRSLAFHARMSGVAARTLDDVRKIDRLWFFSVEFDRILKPADFASDRLYNVHFSKLPAYRGVATSVWPILRGERETGVTFHRIDSGVDTGPIVHQKVFPIGQDWTARDLYFRYLEEGAALFREAISMLKSGTAVETPQTELGASCHRRRDLDYRSLSIDTTLPADRILAQIRAYSFWEYQLPVIAGRKIWSAKIGSGPASGPAGTVRMKGSHRGILCSPDADIELWFSPYEEVYGWALGDSARVPDLAEVPDLDLQDAQGWSAMMKAAHSGNSPAIRLLASAGASVARPNRRGTTPLMYAFTRMVRVGDATAFKELLALGADPASRDQHGKSIVDYAPESLAPELRRNFPDIFT